MRRTWILLAAIILAVAGVEWFYHSEVERLVPKPLIRTAASSIPENSPSPVPSVSDKSSAPAEAPSHLADALNAPDSDIHSDLRIVNAIFEHYRGATHGADPVGENREITAALTGRNKLGFAFIPRDCSALNAQGELCDRWGTPFFFHQLSGTQMEIRSAGPDQKLWTGDDVVLTPGLGSPPL